MRNRKLIVKGALLSVAVLMLPTLGASNSYTDADEEITGEVEHWRAFIELDPAAVRSTVLANEPLLLPEPLDFIKITEYERRPPVRIVEYTEDGDLKSERMHELNVWDVTIMANGQESVGHIVSRNDTFKGHLPVSTETYYVEPHEGADAGFMVYSPHLDAGMLPGMGRRPGHPEAPGQADTHTTAPRITEVAVDNEFVNQYGGMTWPDQVEHIISIVNQWFPYDVQVHFRVDQMRIWNPGTNDLEAAFENWKQEAPTGEFDHHAYWSYKQFSGCYGGIGSIPGKYTLVQHRPLQSFCFHTRPSDDFERAYMTAHELGHNFNGRHKQDDPRVDCPDCPWTEVTYHRHRSILYHTMRSHLHECWGEKNLNAMASHLNTNPVGVPCEAI